MIKYLFTLLLCFTLAGAAAQTAIPKMDLKHTGFVGPDSVNHYVVINVPKVSKADLYKRVLTYVNGLYKNPGAVVSAVDGESITVNATTDAINNASKDWYTYSTNYNIQIQFKDAKIKFEPKIVSIKQYWPKVGKTEAFYVASGDSPNQPEFNSIWMYGSKISKYFLFQKEHKASADLWVNNYIAGIVSKVNDNW